MVFNQLTHLKCSTIYHCERAVPCNDFIHVVAVHIGNVLNSYDFLNSDAGIILVCSDHQLWREAVDDQSQESIVVLNFGSGEIVALTQVGFDAFVFGDDVNIVLNRGCEVEVVALI